MFWSINSNWRRLDAARLCETHKTLCHIIEIAYSTLQGKHTNIPTYPQYRINSARTASQKYLFHTFLIVLADFGWGHPVVLYYKIHNICSYSQTQLSVMSLIKSTHLATGFGQTWSSSDHIYTKMKAVHGLRCKCRG